MFLVIFHCIENKNLTLWGGFCQLPATRLQTGAEEETERLGLVTWAMVSLCQGDLFRTPLAVILQPFKIFRSNPLQKNTSTGLSMTNKKETQPKSGLQAARHLQGRGELQMFFCSCEACEDYRTAWLLCLLRVHIEKNSVWIGNLLRSTEAKL